MDLDGAKRSHEEYARSQQATMIDLARTPPYMTPQQYYTESTLRFTPLPRQQCILDPSSSAQPCCLEPKTLPRRYGIEDRLAIDSVHRATNNFHQTRGRYCDNSLLDAECPYPRPLERAGHEPCAAPTPYQQTAEEQYEAGVDIEHFADRVYMTNAGEGSWSGSLGFEDDIAAERTLPRRATGAIEFLGLCRDALQAGRAVAGPRSYIAPHSQSASLDVNHQNRAWQMYVPLRNPARAITGRLLPGNNIILKWCTVNEAPVKCEHPLCAAPNGWVAADGYYVAVEGSYGTQQGYCLDCLEKLWNAEGMPDAPPLAIVSTPSATYLRTDAMDVYDGVSKDVQPPEPPTAIADDKQLCFSLEKNISPASCDLSLQLDGGGDSAEMKQPVTPKKESGPESLRQSRHVLSPHQPSARPPTFESTIDSTTSSDQRKLPPTRFKHLASYIQPGDTLSSREQVILAPRNAASQELPEWEEYLRRAERNCRPATSGSWGTQR